MATAQSVIDRARQLINDVASAFVSGLRWSDTELLRWLTDGQREIVVLEPEANAVTDIFTVVDTFPRQQLDPAIAYRLIRVEANGAGPTSNLTAAAGCSNTSFGYRSPGASSNFYYPWCNEAGGAWTGDLTQMLPAAGAVTLVVLQSLTSGVLSVLLEGGGSSPPQNVFSSLTFTDKNGTDQTLLSSAATFTQYFGSSQSQWDWNLGSAVLADGEDYTITFNP